jgi:SAM-dependent methyltransferase
MHCSKITNNPNSKEILNRRKITVKAAQQDPVSDRLFYIKQLAKGKEVLDVGIVDHMFDQHHSQDWLHGGLKSVANKILGVDILPNEVEKLKSEGYNVMLHDITASPLNQKFDLIVVGEVIEHLGNPGSLFTSAQKMLKPGGRLILTTPNPYYIARVRDNLRFGFGWDSVDHVSLLFPFGIAEFCERAGLKLDRWHGILAHRPPTLLGRVKMTILKLMPFSNESLCDAIIYECILE